MSPAQHYLAAAAAAAPAPSTGQAVTFWLLAVLAVLAALGMIAGRKVVHCAMLLAVVMLSLAVLYATQGAPFLAFVQVIVYTGAVLMLFLFVVMLIGVSAADSVVETIKGQRLAAGLAGIGLAILLLLGIGHAALGGITPVGAGFGTGNLTAIARLIFTRYVYAFEVTSALLITAAIGAMVLAHRERTTPKPTQRELVRRRLAGGHPTPLPGPGTYAQHNAVDRPALLPDGRPSQLSVSPVIAGRRGRGAAVAPLPRAGRGPAQAGGDYGDAGPPPAVGAAASQAGPDQGEAPGQAGQAGGEVGPS